MSRVRAVRGWEWAVPSATVHREVLSALPAEDTGRPPLLFVHGIAHGAWCFAEHWLPAAAARGFPAYAVSLRGHGGSGGHRRLGRTTTRDYVHDVLQTIVDLPSRPVLVGHSLGAVVVQLVLERYPARAGVLLAPAPLHSALPSTLSYALSNPSGVARALAGGTLGFRADHLFPSLDRPTATDYMSRLGRESPLVQYGLLRPRRIGPVRSPVLVVGGGGDTALHRAAFRDRTVVVRRRRSRPDARRWTGQGARVVARLGRRRGAARLTDLAGRPRSVGSPTRERS